MPIQQLLEQKPRALASRDPSPVFLKPFTLPEHPTEPGPYLEVRSVTRGLASMYERLRNTLDFRDEHLIRVFAIRRILKRRLTRGARAERVALPLLQELVRSGYVPNTAIPERSVAVYERVIEKYIQLFFFLLEASQGVASKDLWDLVFTVAANELEDRLSPSPRRHAVAQTLINRMREEAVLERWALHNDEAEDQYVLAAYRTLFKANKELITWQLFRRYFPDWLEAPGVERVREVAYNVPTVRQRVDNAFRHPARDRLTRHVKPVATTLWLLEEALIEEADVAMVLSHPSMMSEKLQATINRYYKTASQRLGRILRRSLLYIFLTKMAIALLIEIPFDRFIEGSVNVLNIGFNVIVPPLLLLIFGLSVQIPGSKNTHMLQVLAERLMYEGALKLDPLKKPATQRAVLNFFFNLFYGIIYLASFGALVTLLLRFQFNILGIAIFLFFLSIVSFFGFRIREQAQELIVIKGEERFLVFLAVLFFLPILRTGQWISQQSSKINIFLYFFDLFIEAPLQAFLEFFDKFTGFVREKKEDVTS